MKKLLRTIEPRLKSGLKIMVGFKYKTMHDLVNIREIEDIQQLDNEFDLQKALLLDRKSRLLVKENPELKLIHDKLISLIQEYEHTHWKDNESIKEEQFEKAEIAEKMIEIEQKFITQRKEIIRKRLKSYDMNQTELALLLGHKKSYMSELINGVTQFSMKDLVIIHRVLHIELSKLIPIFLNSETRERIKKTIEKLDKPKLKIRKKDLIINL